MSSESRLTVQERCDAANRITFAKRIAAKKLGRDDHGDDIPQEVWKDSLPDAERWVNCRVEERHNGYNNVTISGTCPPDTSVKDIEDQFYHYYFGGRGAWVKDGRFGCTIHTD